MTHKITLIPGEGIGPDVIYSAIRCIDAAQADIEWDVQPAGQTVVKKYGSPLPAQTIESIKENLVALKGPITTPVGKGIRSVNVELRKLLDLFANVRPVRTFPGVQSRFSSVNLVVIRENTEDLYAGIEFEEGKGDTKRLLELVSKEKGIELGSDTAVSLKTASVTASERIVKFAFRYAAAHHRKKVTAVHKANIMKYTDGLFLASAKKVAQNFKITFDDRIVDNMAMQLVKRPQEYDVIVAPNLYGDILSDLCAGIAGGLGLAPAGNYGEDCAVFEPVHGTAPKYAGKDMADPSAAILSSVMMLRHVREYRAADVIEGALEKVMQEGKYVTHDLSSKPVGTKKMTDAVVKFIEKSL